MVVCWGSLACSATVLRVYRIVCVCVCVCVCVMMFGFQREPRRSIVVIWVKICQTELVAENYSKSPVRAIGKVLLR